MLGDRHARGRHDDGRGGRDVEGAAPVAARADDVDGTIRRIDAKDAQPHRRREAGQLIDRFAAHPERDQERPELGRRRLAVHDRAHRIARLLEA